MRTLKSDFMDILENQRIKPVFQPIVCLKTGEIIGYEALSRIIEPKEISCSEELFHLAGIYGKVWELEQLCRRKILEKYHIFHKTENNFHRTENNIHRTDNNIHNTENNFHKTESKKLFLNINPMVIHDKEFRVGFTREYLKQYGLNDRNIVFEVTERNAVDDIKGFKDTIRHYKSQGYNIAIDDAGSCYSGLNLICDIVPHFLKLDIMLIRDIHKDVVKYAMVKSIVEFANLTNIQLVAEGIECEEELKALLKLGVHNGQGFYLRRPDEDLKGVEKTALELIHKYNDKKNGKLKKYNAGMKEFRAVLLKYESYKAYSAYCEKYGDEKGDQIIEVMKNVIDQNLSEEETAIPIGEDSILIVLEKQNYKNKCEIIGNIFRNRIQEYYQKEDIEKGYIEAKNKHGEEKKYPLINICSERVV